PPGIQEFLAVQGPIRSTVKLSFRGQTLPYPLSVRLRFRVSDVYRPVQRQGDLSEHCTNPPLAAVLYPEVGGRRARANELQILRVRDLVLGDGERRDADGVAREFVVPSKPCVPLPAQGDNA